jgi:antitoxin ParD1/3/4
MNRFIVAPDADEDVFHIWRYLFIRAGAGTANRIESELYDLFAALAAAPGQGHTRPDLTNAQVLFCPLYQYLIVYRIGLPLEIVRVLHGRRNVKRLLVKSGLK